MKRKIKGCTVVLTGNSPSAIVTVDVWKGDKKIVGMGMDTVDFYRQVGGLRVIKALAKN